MTRMTELGDFGEGVIIDDVRADETRQVVM